MTYDHPCAFSAWGEEERAAIAEVMASGKFTMLAGDKHAEFEEAFARYHGRKHGIAVNSGSSANLVAVAALFHKNNKPLWQGRAAAVPAIAWATTYAPLVQYGLELKIMDVGHDWNAWTDAVQVPIVVNVPVLGNPMYPMGSYDYLLEDCCESVGARIGGKLVGTFGTLSTFSMFHSHQISAIEGGIILTDEDELADLCRLLRDHGATRSIRKAARFEDEYCFQLMGYNVRPLELHCAIATCQLRKLDDMAKWRRANYHHFVMATEGLPVTHPVMNGEPNPFGLHFECADGAARAKLVAALRANSIDCRLPTGGSFLKHPYAVRWSGQATPRADQIHERGLFLGNAPFDIADKIERAVKVMKEAL